MTKHVTKTAAKAVNAPVGNGRRAEPKAEPPGTAPAKFTYALAGYTAERRKDGWYTCRTVPSFANEKPRWSGPFETVETACLSIGRHLATEIADRHTRSIETHRIARTDALYGLRPTTRPKA